MIAHGLPKRPNRERVAEAWARGGMPIPRVSVRVAYGVEMLAGSAYIVGFLTGWDSLILVAFMLVVTWWSIRVSRERLVSHGTKGYDVNLALLAIFLTTALAGGGAYSLDAVLGLAPYWPVR